MATPRPLPLLAFASALLLSAILPAQQATPATRIVGPIDENQLVALKGNVNPNAIQKNDHGQVSDSLPMAGLMLLLSRTPEQQTAFDTYVQSEYEASSPNFHHWLTPAQIGQLYGPSQADIAAISAWLTGKGFTVTHVAPDGMSISFSGTAGQVTSAFHTEIHQLSVNGKPHIANMSDPQIPAAISSVVSGVKGLHNFLPHPLHHDGGLVHFNQQAGKWQLPAADSTNSSTRKTAGSTAAARVHTQWGINVPSQNGNDPYLIEDVTPYDFATIYNVLPLWTAGTTGAGQTIAIDGTSDITLSDVTSYRSAFGLPAGLTVEEEKGVNGIDPGVCTDTTGADICTAADLEENTLDVEVSGGVATGAQIVLVTSGYNSQTTPTNDPLFDGAQFVVENHGNTSASSASAQAVAGASILSVSYGECELGLGEASNVAYYNLWQTAAAEGISVFVATGDSGSPLCDSGGDSNGDPYSAQYGLSANGLASTPFNTAVGGTDFSWCQPTINSSGSIVGCPTTSSAATPYWNSTSSGTTGESATGYVPETPWNDSCENPIWSAYLLSFANNLVGAGLPSSSNPDAVCNWVQNNWLSVYESYYQNYGQQIVLGAYIDTVGGSGGVSNCVVNTTDSTQNSFGTCTASAGTVTTAGGTVNLANDGWPSPSWQASSGVTGTSGLTARAIPDVSFFAGDGSLDSATLICVSALGSCVTQSQLSNASVEPTAQEVGGTSVATPEMAGVMALINQKSKGAQGLPNKQLYQLAASENYSQCSAESVKNTSTSCYYQSIDQGTITTPCSLGTAGDEGGALYEGGGYWNVPSQNYTGAVSPNCTGLNSGDVIGTLVSTGTTPAYNATAGFNMATGLGSLNVYNVVNAWVSDAGTNPVTMTVTTTPAASSGTVTLASGVSLTIAVTVDGGTTGTPTGTITVAGGGYTGNASLTSGAASLTIKAGSLAPGTDTLTISYSGDTNFAASTQTLTVNAAAAAATVTISAPAEGNVANPVSVSVGVGGPGSASPTGTVTLTGGSYSSTAVTLSSNGTASFTIPAGTLPAGTDTLTADYSGDSNYGHATGTTTITMVSTPLVMPTIKVTPSPTSVDTSSSLGVTIDVTGSGGTLPSGTVTLTSSAAISGSTLASGITAQLSGGVATITVPANNLGAGTDTLSAAYSGDAVYAPGTAGTATVTVTQSTYSLTATTPASVSPGTAATSSITGAASTTGYVGVVTLSTCSITSSPSGAVNLPVCSVSGSITYTGGSTDTPSGTGTATVTTYSNSSAMLNTHPLKALFGAGGTVLAFLVFLGIPARRKSWRALLGAVVLLAGLGTLSACGGGGNNGGGGGGNTATSPGSYTFTVTGAGNDPASTQETTTFTLTVN